MAKPYFAGATEKEFMKVITAIAHRRDLWTAWTDAISLMALSISNAVDKARYDAREARYMKIIEGYTPEEIQEFPKLLAILAQALEEKPDQDFLGKVFMQLELSNKWKGQFFTPFCVSQLMAEMQLTDMPQIIEKQGWMSVCDPCVGAGGMLLAVAAVCRKIDVNYHDHVLFVGQDIDERAVMMSYIQLSLLGCPGYLKVGNTLTEPMTGPALFGENTDHMWFTPFYFKETWHYRRIFSAMDAMMKPIEKPTVILDVPRRKFFFFFEDAAV